MESSEPVYTADTVTDGDVNVAYRAGLVDEATMQRAIYGTAESPSTILSLIADGHLSASQLEARQLVANALNAALPA